MAEDFWGHIWKDRQTFSHMFVVSEKQFFIFFQVLSQYTAVLSQQQSITFDGLWFCQNTYWGVIILYLQKLGKICVEI